jgi:hypothetical protein
MRCSRIGWLRRGATEVMRHDPLDSQLTTLRQNLRSAGRLLLFPTPERVAECDALLRSTSSKLEEFQTELQGLPDDGKQKLRGPAGSLRREVVRLRVLLDGALSLFSGWWAVSSDTAKSYDECGRPVAYSDERQKISVKG